MNFNVDNQTLIKQNIACLFAVGDVTHFNVLRSQYTFCTHSMINTQDTKLKFQEHHSRGFSPLNIKISHWLFIQFLSTTCYVRVEVIPSELLILKWSLMLYKGVVWKVACSFIWFYLWLIFWPIANFFPVHILTPSLFLEAFLGCHQTS